MWEWLCYDNGDEEPLWKRWYDDVDEAVRARHDAIFDFLQVRAAHQWREPHTKKINDDLIEVRIRGSVQHRLLGFFGPGVGQFTIVLGCTHKQQVYNPKDATATAAKRKQAISEGRANVRVCKRPRKTRRAK